MLFRSVLPCVVGMVVFADPILKLIFPNAPDGAFIMQICVLATIFTAMEQTINGALQGLGKVFVPAAALTIGVLLKLILNYILVPIPTDVFPLGGAVGAVFATDVCHFVAFWIVFKVLQKTIHKKISFTKLMFKPLLASGMMALVSLCLEWKNLLYLIMLRKMVLCQENHSQWERRKAKDII